MDEADKERIRSAIGVSPIAWRDASGHGAPSNRRYVLELSDGRTAFAKIAAFDYTAEWLRREYEAYAAFAGERFLPEMLGWDDDGEHPTLVIEDLSDARWPPPWDAALIEGVVETLGTLRNHAAPPGALDMATWRRDLTSWPAIADDPDPIVALGLCTAEWLAQALRPMQIAEDAAPLEGGDTLHMDVRSDNLCLRDGRILFVDWNWVTVGNAAFDVAVWLPSLEADGGPSPEEVVADVHPGFAAMTAGYYLSHATLPTIPQAPHVRGLQLAQARTALPWAARLLGLPPPKPLG
jgi:hypothetical protein